MNNPKISVVIPVYNSESTIRRCVDSVLAQTLTDFECLLINDGSKDGLVRFAMNMPRKIAASGAFRCGRGGTF